MSVVLRRVISGVFCGSLIGAVIGVYVFMLTADSVILRDDFDHVVSWEQAADRFRWTLLISFSIVFALVGPFVANARFGTWLRPAVYGLVVSMAILCTATLIASAFTKQQPVYMHKGAGRDYADAALRIGVPLSFVFGPVIGAFAARSGRSLTRCKSDFS